MVTPATAELTALGESVQLRAEVRDQNGQAMAGASVTWASGSAAVARVTNSGLVTAAANGTATITATAGSVSGTATVTVAQEVSTIALTPAADTLVAGDTLRLAAEALDGNGQPVADAAFTRSSSDSAIATVDTSGMVRAVGEGTAQVTAATGNVRGVARFTVFSSPDRAALVALYNAADGPNWVKKDNWLTDKPLGRWHGVGTDASGRVDFVDLSGKRDSQGNWTRHGLRGTIPPELGRLDKLETLWLYGNELSGTIPAELGDLVNLEELDLSDNTLAGPIPPELGSLAKLKHLLLQNNSLAGALPPEMGDLAQLESLQIENNDLTGKIPVELADLAILKGLELRDNKLTGPIPAALGSLASLKVLDLRDNELTGPIPPELGTYLPV